MSPSLDVTRLERSVNWALRNQVRSDELVRMLRPLVRATSPTSSGGCQARLQLAEHLLLTCAAAASAWEAASLARAVLPQTADESYRRRAYGVLGLSLTALGHYRAARTAYRQALASGPADPVCAHNLGHLEVTIFGALGRGLHWLSIAHRELPDEPEVAASLAHALVRAGKPARAREVLGRTLGDLAAADRWLARWGAGSEAGWSVEPGESARVRLRG